MVTLTFEPKNEQRLVMPTAAQTFQIPINKTIHVGRDCVVMSGYAHATSLPEIYALPVDDTLDHDSRRWGVHLIIGPVWRDVLQVSPMIAPAKHYNFDADEDDVQGFFLDTGCNWDEVEVNGKKRIRLKFEMEQWGEDSRFVGVIYHAVATGFVSEW